jgi:hypothetical protein
MRMSDRLGRRVPAAPLAGCSPRARLGTNVPAIPAARDTGGLLAFNASMEETS